MPRSALYALCALLSSAPLAAQRCPPTVPPAPAPVANARDDAHTILQRYARAWRGAQEMALTDTVAVGFRVSGEGGGDFHAVFSPDGALRLLEGPASASVPAFEMEMETLRRLDRDELSAMTAMGRARMSDPAPLTPRFPPGFRMTPATTALYLPLTFHFWNRAWPEVVRFGEGTTRSVHGAEAAIFYYDRALRTGWYRVDPGMHINADPRDQENPFPSLFILTRGALRARLDGVERTLREGEAVLVPAGMTHEFWAASGEYGELVLVMFGEGA